MALTRKSQKVHRVRFATVPYPNIYLFKNKLTPPNKINGLKAQKNALINSGELIISGEV